MNDTPTYVENFHPALYLRNPNGNQSPIGWPHPSLLALPRGWTIVMVVDWRKAIPLAQKLDPAWLVKNDWDKNTPDWYLPERPRWYRDMMWFGRNPCENAARVLLGCSDLNYNVEISRHDGTAPNGDLIGWEIGRLVFQDGRTLPWVSYQGNSQKFYWGWQPTGRAAMLINGNAWWWAWALAVPAGVALAAIKAAWAVKGVIK